MERSTSLRTLRRGLAAFGLASAALALGCLTRPITNSDPTVKPIVEKELEQEAVDKVDILFAIDNSASMGDKQDLFKEAVPDLVQRLLSPDCVSKDGATRQKGQNVSGKLECSAGLALEFQPVHDLHIGVVTSSLGGGGSPDLCDGTAAIPAGAKRHDDDRGHLVTRTKPNGGAEGVVSRTSPTDGAGGGFLAWVPAADPANAGKAPPNVAPEPDATTLVNDFQSLVVGVQEYGCGLEAQLESWYRFLVQPDPWNTISVARPGSQDAVKLEGVDQTILKQRRDFLRPDSLVAVIMLTDEEDSWSDPLAMSGRAWSTRTGKFVWPVGGADHGSKMPRATSECKTDPSSPDCTSCGLGGKKHDGTPVADDPECKKNGGYYADGEDELNVRYTNDMKRRYGIDPQFPIARYVDGLKSKTVPDRDGEHKGGAGPYLGQKNCRNPLFATNLPDGHDVSPKALCALDAGPRDPGRVFFALVGGVPWQLLAQDASDPKSPFLARLDDAAWTKILGKDPSAMSQDGIDPHMIESIEPRPGLPAPNAADGADPIHGREWKTSLSSALLDLQYACTFELPTAKDCAAAPSGTACDCDAKTSGPGGSPLCAGSKQVRGKAYPTIRELRVAKGLGDQGIVSSLCARNVKDKTASDYGYRPAVDAIVERLKRALAVQCLPRALTPQSDGSVACLVLVHQEGLVCDPSKGLKAPDPDVERHFREQKLAELRKTDPAATDIGTVCEMTQLLPNQYQNGTCEGSANPGWCYVEGQAAGECPKDTPQAIRFSSQVPSGAKISLQCIDQTAK